MGDPEALRADWRAQAAAAGLDALHVVRTAPGLASVDRSGIVAEALARVAAESATWLHADLSRHIATLVPVGAAAGGAETVALVEKLTAWPQAKQCVELQPEAPADEPRRRDGRPVSEAVTDRHLTASAVLDQETRLLG
ncbi:MAG TPA: hypothetical protein VHM89_16305 [Acidimicrobiales bacterium]|nr:hypothetical protein [Acidimicrobiales bacterium]